MNMQDKLQFLRKQSGYSQEEVADKIGIARQTISKWENGQAVPELSGLIALSELYGVTIDRIVKDDDDCNTSLCVDAKLEKNKVMEDRIITFLIDAKKNTYASADNYAKPSRTNSHDFCYKNMNGFSYYDTYIGGERFAGEEAVWLHEEPVFSMNYVGRVIGENFSGDFLKEALKAVPKEMPFRGPEIYSKGDYHYHCTVEGEFAWFQGYEEIFYMENKIYECRFHGGIIR